MHASPPTLIDRVTVRVRRFFTSVSAHPGTVDRALAEEWLSRDQLALFDSQAEADQGHSVAVARLLLRSGYSSRDLVIAALLHDVGKREAHFTAWHRTAIVVLESCAPWLMRRLGSHRQGGLLAPFSVSAAHADHGSDLAAAAGVTERAAYLIRCHHCRPRDIDEELSMLSWADNHA